VKSLSQAQ